MTGKPSTKLFYKIGEVCRLTDIKPHILRYWESEFPALNPRKNRGGQRVYQPKDLETVKRIKRMLYEEGYTIAGARKKLSGGRDDAGDAAGLEMKGSVSGGISGAQSEGRAEPAGSGHDERLTGDPRISDAIGRFKQEIKEILDIIS